MSEPPAELSRRKYAQRVGCHESLIRRLIADGALAPAVSPSGKIIVELADAVWDQLPHRGEGDLTTATRRRRAAHCLLLQDGVAALRASLATSAAALASCDLVYNHVEAVLAVPPELGPFVAGQRPAQACALIDEKIRAVLTTLGDTEIVGLEGEETPPPAAEPLVRDTSLDHLSLKELSVLRQNLIAERLELMRDRKRGALVDVSRAEQRWSDAILAARGRLLYLGGKVAPRLCTLDADEATALLAREIRATLQDLRQALRACVRPEKQRPRTKLRSQATLPDGELHP